MGRPAIVKKLVYSKRRGKKDVYARITLSFLCICMGPASYAVAWGPVAHAVIGQLAEDELRQHHAGLQNLLARWQHPGQRQQVKQALLGLEPPAPGQALRVLANWPDEKRGQPGMLPFDMQRHYLNLPHQALYNRARHCPDGVCSLETLLQQRAILADRHAPLSQRAVALAWVVHLVGDMHQPLHAGKEEDRGGNLTCVTWRGEPSEPITVEGRKTCSGGNLHAIWDSKILEVETGISHPDEAPTLAWQLAHFLPPVKASEPPLTARTEAEWRLVVERWHTETQKLILLENIYPPENYVDYRYVQRHYLTIRRQLLRAAVRLAAMLHQTLRP
jgi:hypothetical protein